MGEGIYFVGQFPGVGSHPPSHGFGATSQRRADFRYAFSVFEFASIREMDSLAPARSALAGLRLCQIPFTASQAVQVVSTLASWRLPPSLHFGAASGVKTLKSGIFTRSRWRNTVPGGGTLFPVAKHCSRSRNTVPGRETLFPVAKHCSRSRNTVPGRETLFPVAKHCSRSRNGVPGCFAGFPGRWTLFPYGRTRFPPVWRVFPVKIHNLPVRHSPFPVARTSFPAGRTAFPHGRTVFPVPGRRSRPAGRRSRSK